MDWVEGIGLFAGFLGVSGWYPQVKRVWIDGRADGISVPNFRCYMYFFNFWLIYGILKIQLLLLWQMFLHSNDRL